MIGSTSPLPSVGPDQSTSQDWPALCSMRFVRLVATVQPPESPQNFV